MCLRRDFNKRVLLKRMRKYIIHVFNKDACWLLTNFWCDFFDVWLVFIRDEYGGDFVLACCQYFFFETADAEDASAERNFTRHG